MNQEHPPNFMYQLTQGPNAIGNFHNNWFHGSFLFLNFHTDFLTLLGMFEFVTLI